MQRQDKTLSNLFTVTINDVPPTKDKPYYETENDILFREKEDLIHPVQFASNKFSPAQAKYSTIERECLAIVWGLEKFARFLTGTRFVLQTDHRPLTFLQVSKTKNSRLLRWALAIQEYTFQVVPIPGTSNTFADILSRYNE
ncbi:hypothetical protein ACOMHN_014488 [Nucella lapillus]